MKIIDAHLHFSKFDGFDERAREAGHINSAEHLLAEFDRLGIEAAVAMGAGRGGSPEGECLPMTVNLAGPFDPVRYGQPRRIAYCAGVESDVLNKANQKRSVALFEERLRDPHCVGIKMYPGYNRRYLNDPLHYPLYELAEHYDVPVAIHTGDTATANALVKYSHPLTVDEVAVNFPRVRFVMAHYGNPWVIDATEVAAKNPNVFIDLSGLAVGNFDPEWFWNDYSGYLQHLKTWMNYLSDYGKFMYGTDRPLVNLEAYLTVLRRLVPEKAHNLVFRENALRIYSKLNALLA